MTREQWRKRMLKAGLPEEVVEATMKAVSDEDLVRMKDMGVDEIQELIATTFKADEDKEPPPATEEGQIKCPKCGVMNPAGATECSECGATLEEKSEEMLTKKSLDEIMDNLVQRVKDELSIQEVDIEIPLLAEMATQMSSLKDQMDKMQEQLTLVLGTVETVTKDAATTAANLSPAQRVRMTAMLGQDATRVGNLIAERFKGETVPAADEEQDEPEVVVKDADGNVYKSLEEWALS